MYPSLPHFPFLCPHPYTHSVLLAVSGAHQADPGCSFHMECSSPNNSMPHSFTPSNMCSVSPFLWAFLSYLKFVNSTSYTPYPSPLHSLHSINHLLIHYNIYLFILLLMPARLEAKSRAGSRCSVLYPQPLELELAHSKCTINENNEWMTDINIILAEVQKRG